MIIEAARNNNFRSMSENPPLLPVNTGASTHELNATDCGKRDQQIS